MTAPDKPGSSVAPSAEILLFPGRPKPVEPTSPPVLKPGDMIVMCVNASVGLWCAWPVAAVDCDGMVMGVSDRSGRVRCAGRLSCDPTVYGLSADKHEAEGFAALRWKTWSDPIKALQAFADIGLVTP